MGIVDLDAEESQSIWQLLFCGSNSESEFKDFTLKDICQGEESDVDLDLIVKQDWLDANFFPSHLREY